MRTALSAVIVSFLLVSAAHAASGYVNVLEPYNYTVYNNGTIYLGNVGPGQPFYVTISSTTSNSTGFLLNYGWNKLVVTGLPSGWIGVNSSLNNQALSAKVSVAPLASNGKYTFKLTAINIGNYSKIGSVTFNAVVNVTPNVFSTKVSPLRVTTGPGQPADIHVFINNTGVSDSPFVISIDGLPAWTYQSTVIALHHTSGSFLYPVYENEPGVYNLRLNVTSASSPLIHSSTNMTLVIKASLPGDYSAIGEGSVGFPIIYAPAYAVMYIIGEIGKLL
jgi:hypothetical protein